MHAQPSERPVLQVVSAGMDPTKAFTRLSLGRGSVLIVSMSGESSVEFYDARPQSPGPAKEGTVSRSMTSQWYWNVNLQLHESVGNVPRPFAFIPDIDAVMVEFVEGEVLGRLDAAKLRVLNALPRLADWMWRLQSTSGLFDWGSASEPLVLGRASLRAEMAEYIGELTSCVFIHPTQLLDMTESLQTLSDFVAAQPQALIHRDMTGNNVLVESHSDRLVVLDFLDLCLGPRMYDLASLLWDRAFTGSGHHQRSAFDTLDAAWQRLGGAAIPWDEVAGAAAHRLLKSSGRRLRSFRRTGESTDLNAAVGRLVQVSTLEPLPPVLRPMKSAVEQMIVALGMVNATRRNE